MQITASSPLHLYSPSGGPIHDPCDRMNMIKYIPELGIVVAASQKGRVAIITLTWQEEIGHSFRVDWILPFSSQDQGLVYPRDQRVPLMGMAVSPMPGFEMPQDIPCIPRDVNPKDWLQFDYRLLNPENDESVEKDPSENTYEPTFNSAPNAKSPSAGQSDLASHHNTTKSQPSEIYDTRMQSEGDEDEDPAFTVPELHAHASRVYQPHEDWHGWHPSRHFRLLLLFCNHTAMSYEFWHKWQN